MLNSNTIFTFHTAISITVYINIYMYNIWAISEKIISYSIGSLLAELFIFLSLTPQSSFAQSKSLTFWPLACLPVDFWLCVGQHAASTSPKHFSAHARLVNLARLESFDSHIIGKMEWEALVMDGPRISHCQWSTDNWRFHRNFNFPHK